MSPVYTVLAQCPLGSSPLDDPQNTMLFPEHAPWTTTHSYTYWLSDHPIHHWNSASSQQVPHGLLTALDECWLSQSWNPKLSEAAVLGWLTDFVKLEGPLWFPSLLWVNKAHRSIFGSPCPFSFQLLRSSMNNVFWVFWLNCQHDLSCSIFFPLPSVNNGLSAELRANIHLDNLPKGVGRWWHYYLKKKTYNGCEGGDFSFMALGQKKEIKVI